MTADIELLPLPEADDSVENHTQWPIVTVSDVWLQKSVQDYARAVAEHNISELVGDRDDLLARLDASIGHGTKLGAAQQRCLDEVLEQKAEIEALRAMLGECYVLAGADTDGDPPERHYRDAVRAVGDLRRDYDEALAEPDYKYRAERLAGLLDEVRSCFTRDDDLPSGLLPRIDAALRDHDQEVERLDGSGLT